MVFSLDLPVQSNLRFSNNQLTGSLPTAITAPYPVSSSSWSSNCITGVSGQYQGCTLADRVALVHFFAATNTSAAGWGASSSGWTTSAHPCTWTGVTCDAAQTVVQYVAYWCCRGVAIFGRVPVPHVAYPDK